MFLNCGTGEVSWESLGLKESQPVHPKGDQSWMFIGRTDAEAETPILWPLHKNRDFVDLQTQRALVTLLLLLLRRFSRVRLCATPSMAAHQAPPSMGFSRQEYWGGLPMPSLKESWALKYWCFWTVVLEKTLESPLDCKEIQGLQGVHPKGDQSWMFIGRTDAEAETPILWPPQIGRASCRERV